MPTPLGPSSSVRVATRPRRCTGGFAIHFRNYDLLPMKGHTVCFSLGSVKDISWSSERLIEVMDSDSGHCGQEWKCRTGKRYLVIQIVLLK